mmetsp:Transcript_21386/g.54462  ORF Transcript_21386/g.54462 Transcript_21386/m.54462 type:complete len:517 (-) Transcript_21386:966-2516(-)|eukprot:CAMPEP_0202860270 /NCGR_PEP_ID=MMETSP1391-20130828/2042_1 /ASSEMBLY_ACC=CAM_ASM_000867 /TAXON_ID=1034604 /ORGANISM="Chlamydomonas leiostraca, Strain SAG 11-49" /LENGTH=516 /DNA_ID=CAMNT_0049539413 /DNA_START=105 /DNA_END=1655 /DNA_ORIENTATION=-
MEPSILMLPDEVLGSVLGLMSTRTLLAAYSTCRSWRRNAAQLVQGLQVRLQPNIAGDVSFGGHLKNGLRLTVLPGENGEPDVDVFTSFLEACSKCLGVRSKVQELHVQGQSLCTAAAALLSSGWPALRSLHLTASCIVKGAVFSAPGLAASLKHLHLSEVQLSLESEESMCQLSSLTSLHLGSLEILPTLLSLLPRLTQLQEVQVDCCNDGWSASGLEQALGQLRHLSKLTLPWYRLTHGAQFAPLVCGCPGLRELELGDVAGNGLGALMQLGALTSLKVHECTTDLTAGLAAAPCTLKRLVIEHCHFRWDEAGLDGLPLHALSQPVTVGALMPGSVTSTSLATLVTRISAEARALAAHYAAHRVGRVLSLHPCIASYEPQQAAAAMLESFRPLEPHLATLSATLVAPVHLPALSSELGAHTTRLHVRAVQLAELAALPAAFPATCELYVHDMRAPLPHPLADVCASRPRVKAVVLVSQGAARPELLQGVRDGLAQRGVEQVTVEVQEVGESMHGW